MRFPARRDMRPDSPELHAEQFLVPIKQVSSLDLLDGTTESSPEILHKWRGTLMSLQECEIAQCSPSQLKMMADSPALASEQSPVPHYTGKVA